MYYLCTFVILHSIFLYYFFYYFLFFSKCTVLGLGEMASNKLYTVSKGYSDNIDDRIRSMVMCLLHFCKSDSK